jgi:hypothetical protein
MTRSTPSPQQAELADPDRRAGTRLTQIQPCWYQLARIAGNEVLGFADGQALCLNAGPGGLLLLMPHLPDRCQVFEVQTSSPGAERTIKLVETCWTRELAFGESGKIYLVGVRSVFEPMHAC